VSRRAARCASRARRRVSRLAFARLVVGARGGDAGAVRGGPHPLGRPGDCALDSSRAAGLLGVRLRGVREVLGA